MPSFPAKGEDDPIEKVEPVSFALTVPLIVDISSSVRNYIQPKRLDAEVAKVRRALYFDLGVPFPGVHLRLNDTLEKDQYRILVNEIPVAAGTSRPGMLLVRETVQNLDMFQIPYERGDDFLIGKDMTDLDSPHCGQHQSFRRVPWSHFGSPPTALRSWPKTCSSPLAKCGDV